MLATFLKYIIKIETILNWIYNQDETKELGFKECWSSSFKESMYKAWREFCKSINSRRKEREVIPYPKNMQFASKVHRKRYEGVRHRKIQPNRYMSKSNLEMVGLFEEVCIYLRRMGWEQFIIKTHPTYARVTCEFLSSFNFWWRNQ